MAYRTIKINENTEVQVRRLNTGSNYNKGVRVLVKGVVMKGWIAKDNTTDESIKEDAEFYLNKPQDNSLLQSLINS